MAEVEFVSKTLENKNLPLRIFCFGTFRVILPNETKSICLGSRHKLWSLFKYLVANKGTAIPTLNIMDLFWSERKEYMDTSPLRTTVCRLKSALQSAREQGKKGLSYIIYHQDTCVFNTNSNYWLDIEEFERLCLEAKRLGQYDRLSALQLYQKAFELYQGDFLSEDLYQEWTNDFRERYHQIFLDSVREAARWYLEFNDYQQTRIIIQQAIKIDCFIEELHVLLIKALLGMGELLAAAEHYTMCSKMFYKEFGIQPSKELKQLYREIKERSERNLFNSKELILKGNLEKIDDQNEPFVCEPELFWSIILVERRRLIRHQGETSLIFFELVAIDGEELADEMKKKAMLSLEMILRKNLRKSDVICVLDDTHLGILLPLTGDSGNKQVLSVIEQDFYDEFEASQVKLEFKCKVIKK